MGYALDTTLPYMAWIRQTLTLKVPLFCPETPIPAVNPVFAFAYDRFIKPAPLRPDAAVEIDSVIEDKFRMLDCHTSQFYAWLPFDKGLKDFSADGLSWERKKRTFELLLAGVSKMPQNWDRRNCKSVMAELWNMLRFLNILRMQGGVAGRIPGII